MKNRLSTKKYWYTTEELEQRWNVSTTDIIHFMECNGLLPSFRASFTCDFYYRADGVNFTPLAATPTDKAHVATDVFTVWAVTKDFMFKLLTSGSVDLSGKLLFNSNMPEIMYKPNVPVIVRLTDVLFTDKAVQQFEEKYFKAVCETTRDNSEMPEPKKQHIIKPEERKVKGLSAIQTAINAYLEVAPDGNKAGFYTFLKEKIKLTVEETLKDGESYSYFFEKVTENGSKEGVYLNHAKEGKKEGEAGYNHYSGSEITSLISRKRSKKKK